MLALKKINATDIRQVVPKRVWSGGTGLTYGNHTPIPNTDERYIKFTDGNGYITITTQ